VVAQFTVSDEDAVDLRSTGQPRAAFPTGAVLTGETSKRSQMGILKADSPRAKKHVDPGRRK